MFSYNGGDLPHLSTHADALRFYEQSKAWRGDPPDGERKLDGAKRHTTIRKTYDGSVACKMYNTDVITYHPDNTITVVPYGSRTTDEFFNSLVRNVYGLSSTFTSGMIQVGDRFYRAIDTMSIRLAEHSADQPEMLTKTEPFRFQSINRARAKAARDLYNYNEFALFARMCEKTGVKPVPAGERIFKSSPAVILGCLQTREKWVHLLSPAARQMFNDAADVSAALTLSDVRDAIYRIHPDVYDKTEEPYLESWRDVERWKRN